MCPNLPVQLRLPVCSHASNHFESASPEGGLQKRGFVAMMSWKCALQSCETRSGTGRAFDEAMNLSQEFIRRHRLHRFHCHETPLEATPPCAAPRLEAGWHLNHVSPDINSSLVGLGLVECHTQPTCKMELCCSFESLLSLFCSSWFWAERPWPKRRCSAGPRVIIWPKLEILRELVFFSPHGFVGFGKRDNKDVQTYVYAIRSTLMLHASWAPMILCRSWYLESRPTD